MTFSLRSCGSSGSVWERHHVLTDAQHGCRPGRGTDTCFVEHEAATAQEHMGPGNWDLCQTKDTKNDKDRPTWTARSIR